MITFKCPSCASECRVGDKHSGRKIRCPRCKAKIRHSSEGHHELLEAGQVPAPAPPAPGAAVKDDDHTTVAIPAVQDSPATEPIASASKSPLGWFTGKTETQQNAMILSLVLGIVLVAVLVFLFLTVKIVVVVGGITAILGVTLVALILKAKAEAKARQPEPPPAPAAKDDETQPLESAH